jgi:hypothetical protein
VENNYDDVNRFLGKIYTHAKKRRKAQGSRCKDERIWQDCWAQSSSVFAECYAATRGARGKGKWIPDRVGNDGGWERMNNQHLSRHSFNDGGSNFQRRTLNEKQIIEEGRKTNGFPDVPGSMTRFLWK